MIELFLGLPHLRPGPLLARAKKLALPILVSANAFSIWRRRDGIPSWEGFDHAPLVRAAGMRLALDSAGFVATRKYGGFSWSAERYIELACRFPFEWVASMDLCVEPEVAGSHDIILDRIAGTINLNRRCRREADAAGIGRRLMPVIQGWYPEDYVRCLEGLAPALDLPLIGVGSMCRRHLRGGVGILAVVEAIDRALGASPTRLHLFGLKSGGAAAIRGHPRVASIDSQAYGLRARWIAWENDLSKTDRFLAVVMEDWALNQGVRLGASGWVMPKAPEATLAPRLIPENEVEARIARSREELRRLVARGELEHDDVNPRWAYESAFDDMPDDA